jgi:lipopolysaccharide transport system permease protein
LLLFLAPVFYPQSALPPIWRPWLNLNPLTFIIESARKTLVGEGLDWPLWWLALLLSLLAAAGGAWCFQKGRRGFADVL